MFNCRLVTTFYDFPLVAEQGHVRKSWMSRVKYPMLRLHQHTCTTQTTRYRVHAGRPYGVPRSLTASRRGRDRRGRRKVPQFPIINMHGQMWQHVWNLRQHVRT